jgi:tetratricopeptide (TPR) repeat protein
MPWVAVNTRADLSVHRFTLMAGNNPLWTGKRIAAARSELAGLYLENGLVAEAVVHFEEAVKYDPGKPRYPHDLGVAYGMLGELNLSEAYLRRALDLDPTEAQVHADLGQVLLLEDRVEEAERALRRAIELDPDLAEAHFNLGRLYEDRGDTLGAIEAYHNAVGAKPHVVLYWHRLALALDRVPGRGEDAEKAWERIVELTEDDPSKANLHEAALGRLGRP